VHGRTNFIQKSEMVLWCMYKNALLSLPQVYFAFRCAFSGQSFYDDFFIANFNFVFTALPYLFRALLDQDINLRLDGMHQIQKVADLYNTDRET
jgi:magnesium-transporting ATPase (P-type)